MSEFRHPMWDMQSDELRKIADSHTEKPERGAWRLVSPSGREFTGATPMQAVQAESKDRIPAVVALARIILLSREEE